MIVAGRQHFGLLICPDTSVDSVTFTCFFQKHAESHKLQNSHDPEILNSHYVTVSLDNLFPPNIMSIISYWKKTKSNFCTNLASNIIFTLEVVLILSFFFFFTLGNRICQQLDACLALFECQQVIIMSPHILSDRPH